MLKVQVCFVVFLGSCLAVGLLIANEPTVALEPKPLELGTGVVLNYIENGTGVPIIFIPGGLEECSLWEAQVREFGRAYRAIAFSRRLNFPNENSAVPDYSAAIDAEDVAALIRKLELEKCHIVGFSYGGTAAMFLAIRHPDLVRTLTLCEPALIPWLKNLSLEKNDQKGKEVYADYQASLVTPTKAAFEKNDVDAALRTTLDYLSQTALYDSAEPDLRELWKRNAKELDAILSSPTGLSAPDPKEVRQLKMPTLLLSGGKSADSCQLVVAEMEILLSTEPIVFQNAGHAMWLDEPNACRDAVLEFLKGK